MHDVFISYSSAEMAQAETVRNILEENGIPCWMAPRDIPGGSNYTREIPVAIRNCQVFVLILSQNAQKSHWVLKELDSAVNCGKVILPFMLEDCTLNDEFNFLLTGAQRYAAYQKKAEALEKLISRIRAVVEHSENAPAPEPGPQPSQEVPKKASQQEYFGLVHCPACGGAEVVEIKKIKRMDTVEWLYLLAIPVGGILGMMLMMVLMLILAMFSTQLVDLLFLLEMIGLIGGCIWGVRMDKTLIRRRRVRRHMSLQTFRCRACDKVFTPETTISQL